MHLPIELYHFLYKADGQWVQQSILLEDERLRAGVIFKQ